MVRPDLTSRWRGYVWLVVAVLVCYANAMAGDFQFDDYKVIVDNPSVHSWDAWLHRAGQGMAGIRPLLKVSYVLNWTSGWGLVGFHAVNIGIHLANTVLVYLLARSFVSVSVTLSASHTPALWSGAPLAAALIFAVHPANTEAVTYICGRSSALMAMFYLAGVLVYAGAGNDDRAWQRHAGVPLCFALALMVKETAVTFPMALLCWEWAAGTPARTIWRRQWSSWLLLLLGAAFFLLNDSYLAHMQRSAELNSLTGNLATQSLAFFYLLRQWATPFWINIDPDLPVLTLATQGIPYLAGLVLVMGLTGMARRRMPWLAFALAWAWVHLVPLYVFLPRLDVANDRQLLLAGWPLGLGLVMALALHVEQKKLPIVLGTILLCLAVLTIHRNNQYATEITLWEATVALSDGKARVHNNLGYAYRLAGRNEDARRQYTRALELDPQHIKARYNLERLDLP